MPKMTWRGFQKIIKTYSPDILLIIVLAVTAGYASYRASLLIPGLTLLDSRFDLWFQTDIPRVYSVLTDKESFHHLRTNTHPLFSIFGFMARAAIGTVLPVSKLTAVKILMSLITGLWAGAFYALFRVMGNRRLDAFLFTSVAALSASSLFGFAVPETFGLGSLGIIVSLVIVVLAQSRVVHTAWYYFINVFTLSITTTNWSAAILATLSARPWRKAFNIFVYTFFIITLLWGIQKYIFPATNYFLDLAGESYFILAKESGGPVRVALSFFYHTMIMPAIFRGPNPDPRAAEWPEIMLTQLSDPGSGSAWGLAAVVIWTLLLGLAGWNLLFSKNHPKVRWFLGLMISGQLLLHSVYGEETFLYSLHFVVLLVPAVALAALGALRRVVLALILVLIPCLAMNNAGQFVKALDFFNHFGTERERVLVQQTFRKKVPWPRGKGHVLLALPGTAEIDKAYHEPGGSFSPAVGSFGVSIWVVDDEGWLVTTAETMALSGIRQTFVDLEGQPVPGIRTETPYYEALWSSRGGGRWNLRLLPGADYSRGHKLAVVVRSAGPAGGPVRSLALEDHQLLVNERWRISIDPNSRQAVLGSESVKGWMHRKNTAAVWQDDSGWGFARIVLADAPSWSFDFYDQAFNFENPLSWRDVKPKVEIDVPDRQFIDCLKAQTAHLMMSLVGRETRPADPVHMPISSHKEAAYIIAALASAGQLEVARQLSEYLAENDFSGGLGPEADAPGLAIWALRELSDRLQDPEYDRYLWPHIARKAGIIEEMLSAKDALYRSSGTPLVPARTGESYNWVNLLAKPARAGLIIGRAESQFPVLYVNATTYRGLLDAAALAEKAGQKELSSRWKSAAGRLNKSWEDAFLLLDQNALKFIQSIAFMRWEVKQLKVNVNNYLTYSNGLWPTGVAYSVRENYKKDLNRRWEPFRNDPAETHQWLYLGEVDRVWKKLRWFWWPNTQESYGLYTWWEGQKERNTFPGWEKVRGWVNPDYVAPQFGVAARMLLLQLEMLGYLDRRSAQPVIVIGQGVPEEWLNHPLRVKGLALPRRTVDWSWEPGVVRVRIHGEKAPVVLGPSFPPETKIEILEQSDDI
jgi:hypothetical protein